MLLAKRQKISRFVKIHLYEKTLEELQRDGVDFDALISSLGCTNYWVGESSLSEDADKTIATENYCSSASGADETFQISKAEMVDSEFPRCSTPIDPERPIDVKLCPSKALSAISKSSADHSSASSGDTGDIANVMHELIDKVCWADSIMPKNRFKTPVSPNMAATSTQPATIAKTSEVSEDGEAQNGTFLNFLSFDDPSFLKMDEVDHISSVVEYRSHEEATSLQELANAIIPVHRGFSHKFEAEGGINEGVDLNENKYAEKLDFFNMDTNFPIEENGIDNAEISCYYPQAPTNVSDAHSHETINTNISHVIRCNISDCNTKYNWKLKYGRSRLIDHSLSHLEEDMIKCIECGANAKTVRHLRRHYRSTHKGKELGFETKSAKFSLESPQFRNLWEDCYGDHLDIIGYPSRGKLSEQYKMRRVSGKRESKKYQTSEVSKREEGTNQNCDL